VVRDLKLLEVLYLEKTPNDLVKVGLDLLDNEELARKMISSQEENIDHDATRKIAEFIINRLN